MYLLAVLLCVLLSSADRHSVLMSLLPASRDLESCTYMHSHQNTSQHMRTHNLLGTSVCYRHEPCKTNLFGLLFKIASATVNAIVT